MSNSKISSMLGSKRNRGFEYRQNILLNLQAERDYRRAKELAAQTKAPLWIIRVFIKIKKKIQQTWHQLNLKK